MTFTVVKPNLKLNSTPYYIIVNEDYATIFTPTHFTGLFYIILKA
jgi:hypothetical protein